MSAFIVDKVHIDIMVRAGLQFGRHDLVPGGHEDEMGRMLWQENLLSVAARYPNDKDGERPGPTGLTDSEIEAYAYDFSGPVDSLQLTPAEALKTISCYEYQSCEHEGWQDSSAHRFCQRLEAAIIQSLPGYEDAPWGWTAANVAKRDTGVRQIRLSRMARR